VISNLLGRWAAASGIDRAGSLCDRNRRPGGLRLVCDGRSQVAVGPPGPPFDRRSKENFPMLNSRGPARYQPASRWCRVSWSI